MKSLRSQLTMLPRALMITFLGVASAQGGAADRPYAADIYVRGSFNAWHTSHPMSYDAQANRYVADIEIVPGTIQYFKIASADWSTVDLGSPAVPPGNQVELGVPELLANTAGYGDLELTVTASGVYSFTLDPTDPANPTLLVTYLRPGGDGAQHFSGLFPNDFGYVDCLGQTVSAVFDVKAILFEHLSKAGAYLFTENLQTDGEAWDSAGNTYAVHDARIFRFATPPTGGFQYNNASKMKLISKRGGTNLFATMIEKVHLDANFNLVREYYFDGISCSK